MILDVACFKISMGISFVGKVLDLNLVGVSRKPYILT